jgi:histidine ammonia-lyase
VIISDPHEGSGDEPHPPADPLELGSGGIDIAAVASVARHGRKVRVGPGAIEALERSYALARQLVGGDAAVYGLSTGFGALADRYIPAHQRRALQESLVRSHAATVGEKVETEVVRGMMLLRAATLAKGYSGVRPDLVFSLIGLLNAAMTPVVREHGSLGCSGDLAPLAHVALALMGEGEVTDGDGRRLPSADALPAAGVKPLTLEAKEGLALTNGTDGMLAMLCLACHDVAGLIRTAEVAAAMSVESLLGTDQVFLPELAALRPHPGQQISAANMLRVLAGSGVVASHRHADTRVQDAYSLRCAPQVLGAVRDTLGYARAVADAELGSAIDNPVVLPDGRVRSCGNFHGAPLGYAADFLAIAVADLASIAERRIDRHLDPARSHGLPPFLAADPGVDSGLMLAHYSAAALVADCRRLAVPASVDSIPTSAMQEDHVSMGWAAARKLRRSIDNATRVVAIEALTAARAVELRRPHSPAPATGAVLSGMRRDVPGIGRDRYVAPEVDAVTAMVQSGAILAWAESETGPLD